MVRWAEPEGTPFLPALRDAFDPSGFPKEKFHAEDVACANAKYGALVLEQSGAIVENSEGRAVYG